MTTVDPPFLAAGIAVGTAAAASGLLRPRLAPAVAAVGAALVLVPSGRASGWVVAAALVLAVGADRSTRGAVAIDALAAVALAAALHRAPDAVWSTVGVCGLLAVGGLAGGRRLPGRLPAPPVGVLLAATGAVLWLCAPDTEEVIAVGAAIATAVVIGVALDAVAGRRSVLATSWLAPVVVLVWAAGQGFRGRPGGVPVLLVATAGVVSWPVAESLLVRLGRTAPASLPRWTPWVAVIGSLAIGCTAARTFGLHADLGRSLRLAGTTGGLVVLGWTALAARSRSAPS